jgi:RNA polymerase sigma factor (sigma-70 family)
MSVFRLKEIQQVHRLANTTSLAEPIGDRHSDGSPDEAELVDVIPDSTADDPQLRAEVRAMDEAVKRALLVLDERERAIVSLRFGLETGIPETLEAVGKKFGLTRERIRKIQDDAISKLSRNPDARNLLEGLLND